MNSRHTVAKVRAAQVAASIPVGIRQGEQAQQAQVEVCGNNCPDRNEVASTLREAGISVVQQKCLGGCALSNELTDGTYAIIPEQHATQSDRELVAIEI